MLLKPLSVLDEKAELKILENSEKRIVFIPMHHIGKPSFYRDVSTKIDSLQKLNYLCLYEGVETSLKDSAEIMTMLKKLRKIFGLHLFTGGYLDTSSNALFGAIPLPDKYDLMNQPSLSELRVDTASAIRADIPLDEILRKFEAQFGEVTLEECDLMTPLDSAYNCESVDKVSRQDFRNTFVRDIRNQKIVQTINSTDSSRIVILFGKNHLKGVLAELKKTDPEWAIQK